MGVNQIKKEAGKTAGIIFDQLYDLIRENDYHSLLDDSWSPNKYTLNEMSFWLSQHYPDRKFTNSDVLEIVLHCTSTSQISLEGSI
jgi:hypothetical protein